MAVFYLDYPPLSRPRARHEIGWVGHWLGLTLFFYLFGFKTVLRRPCLP